jgi:hypothetical protein
MADVVPSKSSALTWAAQKAVQQNPYDWDDDLSWKLGNEERYRGIGRTEIESVIDALRGEEIVLDLRSYLNASGAVNWVSVVKDLKRAAMSEFIKTPYGVLFMDCG